MKKCNKHFVLLVAALIFIEIISVHLLLSNNHNVKKHININNNNKVESTDNKTVNTLTNPTKSAEPDNSDSSSDSTNEKRGTPTYDYITGSDGWPHFRVFFWVPKYATTFTPYADKDINTDVSEHGPVEKWAVVDTKEVKDDEKLVFIYVPKTFVFLYGKGFEKVIHLKY